LLIYCVWRGTRYTILNTIIMKTVKFYTLGCKVNQYDTQSIRERFLQRGFKEVHSGAKADVYVINTCTVTASADQRSRSLIRNCGKNKPGSKVIVTGCLAANGAASLTQFKEIDLIISKKFFPENINSFSGHTRAFLKIQDGCNNFCSYCKVPLVRGTSRSRAVEEIIYDAKRLVENGFKEIVLTGICLGAYGKDLPSKTRLVDVITKLEKISGLSRLRLSSIEAGDVSRALINKIALSKKVCRHFHIPIQSGDDIILKKMKRRYNKAGYLKLINKIKQSIPDIAITTDVLVGFPGEGETNFKNTIDLVKKILPLKTHIFPYSKRSGTYAADNLKEEVDPFSVKERILCLNDVARDCAFIYKKQFLNKKLTVLMEDDCKEKAGYWQGYTGNYIKVLLKSKQCLKNQLITVKLKKIEGDYMIGKQ